MEPVDMPLSATGSGRGGGFGKYHFIAELARGGTAVVHLAAQRERSDVARLVAVKELRNDLLDDEAAVGAFLEGARIAARLDHPNLVQTFEVGRYGFRRFQAMEYVEGSHLSEVAQRARRQGGPMPMPMLLRALTDVLGALEYAHSLADADGSPLGLVHRDVGLHNVMMTYEGVVKILDFGTSKAPDAKTAAGTGHGRREDAYPAPECLYGLPVDRRADVFAVGVMLWQGILMRRSPESTWHSLSGPESVRADIDPKLFAIVERAMNADPSLRYPTALAMRQDLESFAARSQLALPDARDLAAFVSPLFARKREQQRAMVDAQLRLIQESGSTAQPSADGLRLATTPPVPSVTVGGRFSPDSLAPTEAATPHAGAVAARESGQPASGAAAMDVPAARRSGVGRGVRRFALAATCGALAGVAWVLLSSGTSPRQASGSAAPPMPVPQVAEVIPEQVPSASTPPIAVAADATEQVTTSRTATGAMAGAVRLEADETAAATETPLARSPVGKVSLARVPSSASATTLRPPAPPAPAGNPPPAAAPPRVETPPTAAPPSAPATSTPASAIDPPVAKPARDIFKQNPYLQ